MARAETITQLSLDRFFQILGVHPLHGNQVSLSSISETCGVPIFQYSWQTADRTSREEVAQAIFDAERLIAQYTNFDIGLRWNPAEEHSIGRFWRATTDMKFLKEGGQKALTLLVSGETVTYSDEDMDGYKETATISFNNGEDISEDEVAIFYPDKGEEWRVRPITVTVDHTTFDVTITTRRERLVLPEKMEALNVEELDGMVDANFLDEVDVYRIYNDPSKQVEFLVHNHNLCTGPVCTESVQDGCMLVRNERLGIVNISAGTFSEGVWSASAPVLCGWPYKVRLWYRAGLERDIGQWERATAYLALSLIDRPICQCQSLEHVSRHWQEDLALRISSRDKSTSYQIPNHPRNATLLDNPIGTTRAALFVWNLISNNYVGGFA